MPPAHQHALTLAPAALCSCCVSHPLPLCSCLQAIEKREKLADILKRTRVKPEYLWRKAKQHDPKLRFKMTVVKPEFTEEEKLERVNFCLKMLAEPPEWLNGIVWVDESSVPFDPKPCKAIGRAGEELLTPDPRAHHHNASIPWIHYLLAVNYAVGLVKIDILSYTKGHFDPVQYYVSASRPLFALACPP